jgi:anti-sigma B factor antagonist
MTESIFDIVVDTETRSARLSGELDLASCDRATEALAPLVEDPGNIELDLSDLRFLDSSGIRVIVQAQRSLGERGSIVLRSPNRHIVKILEIAGIKDLGVEIKDAGA